MRSSPSPPAGPTPTPTPPPRLWASRCGATCASSRACASKSSSSDAKRSTFRWVPSSRSELTSVVEVRFKGNRLEYFTWPAAEPLAPDDAVIVEVERGQDLGRVSALGESALKKCGRGCHGCTLQEAVETRATRRIVRRAAPGDVAVADQLRGREYCSASWLPELRPVNLSVAKDQHLSLNPAQISGPCGRLLCCLHYEHDFYVESRKRFPKEGKVLRTTGGAGPEKVLAVDIFR